MFLRFSDRELLAGAAAVTLLSGLVGYAEEWPRLDYHTLRGMPLDIFFDGIHPVLPWIAFVLLGMWIGRRDLRDPGTRRRLMLAGALVWVSAELLAAGLEALAVVESWPPELVAILTTGWSPDPLYVVAASGTSALAIGLCQELVERAGADRLRALISAGQLSLSLYILHALVGVGIPRWLMDLEDATPWRPLMLWWLGFCVLAVLAAYAWRRRFSRGPLEWIMRKLCGRTPPVPPPGEVRATRAPPRWPWLFVGVGILAIATVRAAGVVAPALDCGPEVALEARVVSELTLACPQRGFVLEIDEAATVELEVASGRDLFLELYGESKRVAVDDDSGLDLNPLLVRELRPGRYRVVIRPYDTALGPFALSARRSSITHASSPHVANP